MKNKLNYVFLVLLTFLSLTWSFTGVSASENHLGGTEYSDTESVTMLLKKLQPFVTYKTVNGHRIQFLDVKGARQMGITENIISLAKEMIAYQNKLFISGQKDVRAVSMSEYPRLMSFSQNATQNALSFKKGNVSAAAINPCGDWKTPIPNKTPKRYSFSHPKPKVMLPSLGFHPTSDYACGSAGCSAFDFTRAVIYKSSYGTCPSPLFRDQGQIPAKTTGTFTIQYGEPNPEILGISWPYWNWGVYVKWWHDTY